MIKIENTVVRFTFQYGSIKAARPREREREKERLHSNMDRLKLEQVCTHLSEMEFTFQYGSIKADEFPF